MQLICPAGSLPSLKAAVDNGADAVYVGFRDRTNARAFPGLNFTEADLRTGVDYAHGRGCQVYLALNTYPGSDRLNEWYAAVDRGVALGIDVLICADPAVLDYALRQYPGVRRHLSVQGSATTHAALRYYRERFDISRAVLPRVLSLTQIERLCAHAVVPLEVFAFGSLCIMVEGRCQLSSCVTGRSPNRDGVCSPAQAVRWVEEAGGIRSVYLNDALVDRFGPSEPAGYPVVCKGRYLVDGKLGHALEEPTSLNTLDLLPKLQKAGVMALKIEGRQRGVAYVESVTRVYRQALDELSDHPESWIARNRWRQELARHAEGRQTTFGAYHRPWQ